MFLNCLEKFTQVSWNHAFAKIEYTDVHLHCPYFNGGATPGHPIDPSYFKLEILKKKWGNGKKILRRHISLHYACAVAIQAAKVW